MGRCLIALLLFGACDAVFGLEEVELGEAIGVTCAVETECVRGGEQGHCECGYCSYADPQMCGHEPALERRRGRARRHVRRDDR